MKRSIRTFALVAASLLSGTVFAQSFPNQRVTLVVPVPAGGPYDVIARVLASGLEQSWKQTVIVENRVGAGGLLGSAAVAQARPDGHTLLVHTGSVMSATKLFVAAPPLDPERDLRPLTNIFMSPYIVTTNPNVPAKTLAEFVSYAKQRPGALNYATTPFTGFDLDVLNFLEKAGVQMNPIPFPGAAPSVLALVRNDVQMWFASTIAAGAQLKEGKLTPLAVTSATRYGALPAVPTLRELGIDYVAGFGAGLLAPAQLPDDVAERIARDAAAVAQSPAVAGRIRELGFEVVTNSPRQWAQEIQAEKTTYARFAAQKGIKPQ